MSHAEPGPVKRQAEAARLFAAYARTRDPVIREQLARRFMPLARHLARRYRGRGDADDLEQIAYVGLLKAIERYDVSRGMAFSTFAVPTILGELRRHFRDQTWTVRVPRRLQELALRLERVGNELNATLGRAPTPTELAKGCGESVEDVLEALATASARRPVSLDQLKLNEDDGGETLLDFHGHTDAAFDRVENAALVDELLLRLPPREREILHLRFREDLTQAEIGRRMGLSQMQVSRLLHRGIDRLRDIADAAPVVREPDPEDA